MGGMIAATFIAIFFVPMFYVLIEKVFHRKQLVTEHAEHSEHVGHVAYEEQTTQSTSVDDPTYR